MMVTMGDRELGGVSEIAKERGVGTNQVAMWAARRSTNGFPQPVVSLAMGNIYDLAEVRAWYASRPEPRNRPKASTP